MKPHRYRHRLPLVAIELERPLVFLDIEGTGKSATDDRIVELAVIRFDVDEPWPRGTMTEHLERFNPGRPIDVEAIAVHGITDIDVADCPAFADKAAQVLEMVNGVDFAGYNLGQYDLPMLAAEFGRVGLEFAWESRNVIDCQQIYFRNDPRDLTAAVRRYAGRELEGAHSAMADTEAVVDVLIGQLEAHNEVPRTALELDGYCRRPEWADRAGKIHRRDDGVLVFGFGKYAGQPLTGRLDYCHWMLSADFPRETKAVIREVIGA